MQSLSQYQPSKHMPDLVKLAGWAVLVLYGTSASWETELPMFIDYAELMAEDEILMSMQDWLDKTDDFLKLNRKNMLEGKGLVSHKHAVTKTNDEYENFRAQQDKNYISDFDIEFSKYLKGFNGN